MPGPGSWGNLAKKRVIPFKRGKKEGNKRRMAQTPDEKTYVETPFIEHLKEIGWDYVEGDMPYLTEREGFREVLLAVDDEGLLVDQAVERICERR